MALSEQSRNSLMAALANPGAYTEIKAILEGGISGDLTLGTNENIIFSGTTGTNEIRVVTNLADALSIEDSNGDLIVIDTTTGAQIITITPSLTVAGTLRQGATAADRAAMKGIYVSGTVAVTVPSITDPDCAKVDVDVSAMTFAPAVGDMVIAIPLEALPTNCRLNGSWVNATDQVQVNFQSEGGNVTGAAKNFKFLFIDLT